jgi:methylenetetrahydrofolate reductase (NADPH)
MKVIEHLQKNNGPVLSFEIVPPPRGRSVQDIVDIVEQISPYNPAFIDVTSHSAHARYQEMPSGVIQKRVFKKRPGTIGICGIIQNRFKIDTVAHLLCNGFTKEETEDALIELNFLGVHNILALRGDETNHQKAISPDRSINRYAADLVKQVMEIREGKFLDDLENARPHDFGVGVAGYPEKHYESANKKVDIKFTKEKVLAGAEYIMTQMFFDNIHYFEYVDGCRAEGITVPIIPGIKVIQSASQLRTIPKNFHIDFPDSLVDEMSANPKHVKEIGKAWTLKQCEELINKKVPSLHFYIMNDASAVVEIIKKLF